LQTAVVGVFIEPGKQHKELEKIWANLPEEENEQIAVTGFHPHNILPGKKSSFRYPGSLTTPPCTEGVSWNILSTPITMSVEQIEKFQGVFSGEEFPNGNARPTQPLGDRVVTTDAK
jgi:carbonic anhydrase